LLIVFQIREEVAAGNRELKKNVNLGMERADLTKNIKSLGAIVDKVNKFVGVSSDSKVGSGGSLRSKLFGEVATAFGTEDAKADAKAEQKERAIAAAATAAESLLVAQLQLPLLRSQQRRRGTKRRTPELSNPTTVNPVTDCTFQQGVDYPGQDMQALEDISTVAECCTRCINYNVVNKVQGT
jgi:hypothetical protein